MSASLTCVENTNVDTGFLGISTDESGVHNSQSQYVDARDRAFCRHGVSRTSWLGLRSVGHRRKDEHALFFFSFYQCQRTKAVGTCVSILIRYLIE